MKSGAGFKILIVFGILLTFTLILRMIRFLIPIAIAAIVIGFVWELLSGSNEKDQFDDYEEL